jgi:hypothetical protein
MSDSDLAVVSLKVEMLAFELVMMAFVSEANSFL